MFSRRRLLGALTLIPSVLGLRAKPIYSTTDHGYVPDTEHNLPIVLTHRNEKITMLGDHCYCVEDKEGTKKYYFCHLLHRHGFPAIIKANGEEEWYLNGERHRIDGPAVIHQAKNSDGSSNKGEYWYRHGKSHREDGPACTYEDGHKEWRIDGQHHREDGPAMILCNGTKRWYQNDKLHRVDGPAIEEVGKDRDQEWWVEGKRHREDGPAKIQFYRDEIIRREWWVEGKEHREDGPAVEDIDGAKYWYKHGVHLQSVNKHGEITFSKAYTEFSLMQI